MPTPDRKRVAAAVTTDGLRAPRVVAAGRGKLAEEIVAAAEAAGIPLRDDPLLAEALAALDADEQVPPELYRAVAEALLWAYRLAATA